MPPEIEIRVAKLDFIQDSEKRLQVAQKTLNPPKFSNLRWLVEILGSFRSPEGWLDSEQMRLFQSASLIPRTFSKTADGYIALIEEYQRYATPQLSLTSSLEVTLITAPFRIITVEGVEEFLSGIGLWSKDWSGRRRTLLNQSDLVDGGGSFMVRDIIKEALASHRERITADNLR